MHYSKCTVLRAVKNTLMLCVLTLALSGCVNLGAKTSGLPPAPQTPGAVVTKEYICIPHAEAAELMLWIEAAEAMYD